MIEVNMPNQEAKKDAGKPKLTLVPRQIIFDIAEVREYGNNKYGDSENWKTVSPDRYRDAAFRHFMAYLDDPDGVDKESGISHLKHLACNISFLSEFAAGKVKQVDTKKELKVEPEDDFVFIDFDPKVKYYKSNIDFDEDDRDDNKNNWMDFNEVKPPMAGRYEFKTIKEVDDGFAYEAYYIKVYDIVIDHEGTKWNPGYWRSIK